MLSASISVPPDVPRDLQVSTFMKDKDGLWFQAPALRRPDAGKTRRLDFNLAPAEGLVVARGHGATWSPYHAGHVTEMGLQIFSPSQWRGSVTVGGVTVTEAAVRPLGIVGFELATGASTAYDPVEFSFDLSTPVIHPFDPTECDIEAVFRAPSGRETRRKAFFYQPFRRALNSRGEEELTANGRSAWRVRFTPVESGRHDWMLQAKVAAQSLQTQWHPLDVQPCRPRGFVRVSERDPRYFETADGQFFYPIGQNIHSPLDRRSAQMLGIPLPPNRGTFAYDDYFRKMAAHGENAVIIWMCNWWVSIEWTKRWRGFHGLNDYNLASAWRLDYLLDAAARNGIHVLLVLDNHGKLSKYVDSEWDTSPYNRVNGGPCLTPEQFFTSPRAWEYYRRRLDYIVARWGSHPNLIGYEIVSEMNLVGTSAGYRKHPDHMVWVRNVAKYLDRIDAYARPITVQYSTDYQSVDERVASLQGLDFLVGDAYKPGGSIVPLMIKTAEANSRFGKPTFSAEFGGNWNATTPARLHADLHAGLWTNAMTVSSAAPFFWWFDFVDRYDLYGEYAALASFLKGEDRRGMKAVTACPTVQRDGQDAPELGAVSLMGEECAYVWVFDRSGSEIMPEDKRVVPHTDVTCGLSGLKFGRYRVEYWDTRAGTVTRFETRDVDDDGVLTLAPPPFRVDTAVKAKRMKGQR
jgi:hypothetical protein